MAQEEGADARHIGGLEGDFYGFLGIDLIDAAGCGYIREYPAIGEFGMDFIAGRGVREGEARLYELTGGDAQFRHHAEVVRADV